MSSNLCVTFRSYTSSPNSILAPVHSYVDFHPRKKNTDDNDSGKGKKNTIIFDRRSSSLLHIIYVVLRQILGIVNKACFVFETTIVFASGSGK